MRSSRTYRILLLVLAALFVVLLAVHFRSGPALDAAAVITQVRQLSQLSTVRYTIQKVVGLEDQTTPLISERILLVMQATAEAGIDLGSLQSKDVSRRPDGTLVLRMPPAVLLHVSVDENETKVWDRQKTWWAPWVPYSNDLEKRARLQGLEAVRKAALDMGILKHAERNAETSIRSLLELAGIDKVVIIPASAS